MRLILVRHGETACNITPTWHGWDHCRLTEKGLRQAQAVANRLAGEKIDALYSSDSLRAIQTAEKIAEDRDLEPILDERLRERNAGEFEGIAVEDVVARHPAVWEERSRDYWNWRPPAGEPFSQVLERVLDLVREIQGRHADETVVAVTHMGTTRVLISHFAGISLEKTYEMEFPSTGISIFSLNGSQAETVLLNDAAHATVNRVRPASGL